ncbi:hypothetical protein ABER99_21705 [Paenibacillus glucanolyticus]|jgi:hypothetical protein|uniref:Uncharacterized protein n=2 Tax=Paenibacillus TaxID=44249 RepID=A0A163GRK0_9BACL|nr:hypothetical protein [Paenibacillus glucanolyticus]KZS45113.1 hypothetical protein AWU65_03790 [Paenibacillus glucanolyticus]OMF63857.1 hypothetical protein BK142_32460 [Paenibacillus glucanolyticus]
MKRLDDLAGRSNNPTSVSFKHVLTDFQLYTENYHTGSQLSLPSSLTQQEMLSLISSEYERLTGILVTKDYTVHLIDIQHIIDFELLDDFQQRIIVERTGINPLKLAKQIMATGRPTKQIALLVGTNRAMFDQVNDEMLRFLMKSDCVFISKTSIMCR